MGVEVKYTGSCWEVLQKVWYTGVILGSILEVSL